MPEGLTAPLIVLIVMALAFDFINGFHDTANAGGHRTSPPG
jgi:phosphate/sulfate permease